MIASELLTQIYYAYRGKGATKVPVWGSEKANTAISIANRKKDEWAKDTKQMWNSLFRYTSPFETGTVATNGTITLTGTGTKFTDYKVNDTILVSGESSRVIASITSDTSLTVTVAFSTSASSLNFTHTSIIETAVTEYNLHRRFMNPSGKATVYTTQNNYLNFARPQNMDGDIYLSGINPKKITFIDSQSITSISGGSLIIPGYYLPNDLVNSTDEVEVDDAYWLAYATAAELARNDPAKEDQFANLIGISQELYANMVIANRNLGFQQMNSIPINMPIIGDMAEDWSE